MLLNDRYPHSPQYKPAKDRAHDKRSTTEAFPKRTNRNIAI
jgi:hypothetical protein